MMPATERDLSLEDRTCKRLGKRHVLFLLLLLLLLKIVVSFIAFGNWGLAKVSGFNSTKLSSDFHMSPKICSFPTIIINKYIKINHLFK